MKCSIYRSPSREYTYLYILDSFDLEDLPKTLAAVFGDPEFVMELELSPDRELAQEDVNEVMANLDSQGFHLQMPPKEDPSGWLDLPDS